MEASVTIGITGATGLLGQHLQAFLRSLPHVKVKVATRQTFEAPEMLVDFVQDCQAIVHFAGMNRGSDSEVFETNVQLTEQLVAALDLTQHAPHVIFSSSTHIERETLYGAAKRRCAELLEDWAHRAGARASILVLPGVFGEGGKPFYNSVVSTFCYQLAHDQQPTIHADAAIEQIHAQEVARLCWALVSDWHQGTLRVQGQQVSVQTLLSRLQDMHHEYQQHLIPDLHLPFDRDLFNTYRSYLYPERYPVALQLHSDQRGFLYEAVKSPTGGQTFLSTTYAGITRGNHFHTRKVERFLVIAGEAQIKLRHVLRDEVITYTVSGERPSFVDIPTLHTHNITNTGKTELVTLFWTNEIFDPANPDTTLAAVE